MYVQPFSYHLYLLNSQLIFPFNMFSQKHRHKNPGVRNVITTVLTPGNYLFFTLFIPYSLIRDINAMVST